MSSLPLKPPAGPKKLKELLEKCTAREAYEILAAQIILANERTRDSLPTSRVQAESRKISITESGLQDIRTGRYGRVQLPQPGTGPLLAPTMARSRQTKARDSPTQDLR